MKIIDPDKRGCFLSGISDSKSLNKDKIFVDFIGFTPRENSGSSYWNWAVTKDPYLYTFSSESKKISLAFELETSPCFKSQTITIENARSGEIVKKDSITDKQEIRLDLDFGDTYLNQIKFSTDADVCEVKGDPRGLYFNVKNLTYQEKE
jgi:hypothetical protein